MSQPLGALKIEIIKQIERHGMTKCTVKGCNDMRLLTAVLEHLEQLEAQIATLTQERNEALDAWTIYGLQEPKAADRSET